MRAKNRNDVERPIPALTPEARENQIIVQAVDLAEQQILNGTASSQIITHYLRLASCRERERLEREKLRKEIELLDARTRAVEDSRDIRKMYEDAMNAMKVYRGESAQHEQELS